MYLYLSSYQFGNQVQRLRDLVEKSRLAVVIANALDFTADVSRKDDAVRSTINALQQLDFVTSEVDLRGYFGNPNGLAERLGDIGLIWTLGGNSFLLRRAMELSGLDAYLLSHLQTDLVYGGFSAGAVVVTPTLRGIHLVDPPEVVSEVYKTETEIEWEGLALVPYCIAPHFDSRHPESDRINDVIEYFRGHKIPYKTMRDGDVIISRVYQVP